jgi:hypothetical protein
MKQQYNDNNFDYTSTLPHLMTGVYLGTKGKYRQPNLQYEFGWSVIPNVKKFKIVTQEINP